MRFSSSGRRVVGLQERILFSIYLATRILLAAYMIFFADCRFEQRNELNGTPYISAWQIIVTSFAHRCLIFPFSALERGGHPKPTHLAPAVYLFSGLEEMLIDMQFLYLVQSIELICGLAFVLLLLDILFEASMLSLVLAIFIRCCMVNVG
jgi:hypothetical protein